MGLISIVDECERGVRAIVDYSWPATLVFGIVGFGCLYVIGDDTLVNHQSCFRWSSGRRDATRRDARQAREAGGFGYDTASNPYWIHWLRLGHSHLRDGQSDTAYDSTPTTLVVAPTVS
jgi:hypothetical protein